MRIDSNGDLVIATEGGEVRFDKPVVYQPTSDPGPRTERRSIDGRYVLLAENQVGFELSSYDKTRPLVIDPVLSYATYLGRTNGDAPFGIAVDSSGSAYVTGYTYSSDFPTASALYGSLNSAPDVFVTKMTADGSLPVYSTYLGGSDLDYGYGIAVDSSGNAYVAGKTSSTDFPWTPGAFQTSCRLNIDLTCEDAVVMKFSALALPVVYLNPTSLNFGSVGVSVTSTEQFVTLENRGDATLNITSVVASGDFAVASNNCGSSVAAGSSCSIGVTLTPSTTGSIAGTLTFTDDAYLSPHILRRLSGTGIPVPIVGFSVPNLDFGSQWVGTTSAPQSVTLTNTGTAVMTISAITTSGDFGATHDCPLSPATLAIGASCTIDVTFTPSGVGASAGSLTITDDAPGSPQTVGLTGSGTPPPNPVPLINQPLVPASTVPGGGGFTLTVNGTGFVSSSVVKWNGSSRTTTFVNGTRLTASIPASDLAAPGTASVAVVNPAPGGGTSNVAFFHVTLPTSSVSFSRSDLSVGTGPETLTAGDFNRDGKLDLAVATGSNTTMSVLLGNGDGTFQGPVNYATSSPGAPITRDFNGDGNLDLAGLGINQVSVLLGNGDGTFQSSVYSGTGNGAYWLVAGDFNGDGKLDVANSNASDSTVSVLLGNGDGTFQTHVDYGTGDEPRVPTVGDFNQDNNLDLAAVNFGGFSGTTVSVLLGNGDGTFQPKVDYATDQAPLSVTTADFNGDGKLDLAVDNSCGHSSPCGRPGTVSILLGNGDGTFSPRVDYDASQFPYTVAEGDFNGDGKLDLTLTNLDSNTVSILLGNGDGTFQTQVEFATGVGPVGVVTGDFNGDGRMDIAAGGRATVTVLLQPTPPAPAVTISPASVNFPDTPLNVSSATQAVTITNAGTTDLVVSSVNITAPFSQTNTCGSPVAPGQSCVVNVGFTPTVAGTANGVLTITSNATGSPHTVAVTGNGTPACALLAQVRTATVLRGTESANFDIKDHKPSCSPVAINLTCTPDNPAQCALNPTVIAPGGASTLKVSNLRAVGAASVRVVVNSTSEFRTASEAVTVLLADFAFTSAPDAVSVAAGETASYALAIRPVNGLAGTVSLACSGAPRGATCTVTPASVTLDGVSLASVQLTVTTTGRASAPGTPFGWPPHAGQRGLFFLALLALGTLATLAMRRRRVLVVLAALLMLLGWAACGGGGGSMNFTSGGTPAGTYALMVTGTYTNAPSSTPASLTNSTTVTLKVN